MLTDPKLRAQVDALWDKFWTDEQRPPSSLRTRRSGTQPPLDMFGADAVERWFTEKEVKSLIDFFDKLIT